MDYAESEGTEEASVGRCEGVVDDEGVFKDFQDMLTWSMMGGAGIGCHSCGPDPQCRSKQRPSR